MALEKSNTCTKYQATNKIKSKNKNKTCKFPTFLNCFTFIYNTWGISFEMHCASQDPQVQRNRSVQAGTCLLLCLEMHCCVGICSCSAHKELLWMISGGRVIYICTYKCIYISQEQCLLLPNTGSLFLTALLHILAQEKLLASLRSKQVLS